MQIIIKAVDSDSIFGVLPTLNSEKRVMVAACSSSALVRRIGGSASSVLHRHLMVDSGL